MRPADAPTGRLADWPRRTPAGPRLAPIGLVSPLADFIRSHEPELLRAWEQEIRAMPNARAQPAPLLVDEVPNLLERIAQLVDSGGAEQAAETARRTAERHALDRLEHGFDLEEMLAEMTILRRGVLRAWSRDHDSIDFGDLDTVLTAFDVAVQHGVARYVEARNRLVEALERIGAAAIEADDVSGFLRRLLDVFLSTADVADCATILLREGNRLYARASIGLEQDVERGFSVPIGAGFPGRVAAERRPLLLQDASRHPMIVSDALRARGIRALYGVPLVYRDELLGVAYIGSTRAVDFPELEKRLFVAASTRASFALAKQMFREAADRGRAELEATIRSMPDAVYIGTAEGIAIANDLALSMLGYDRLEDLNRHLRGAVRELHVRDAATGAPVPIDEQVFWMALQGRTEQREIVVQHRKTGRDVYLRSSGAPVVHDGRTVGAVVINSDITQLKELERERVDFMNAVVHDVRNPLQAVRMLARSIATHLERHGERALAERAHRIDRHAERMNRLLGDLLDLTLATTGGLSVVHANVAYDELVAEVVADWQAASPAHRIVAHLEPAVVVGDADRLRQVLGNLLSNAVKYSPAGGRITVEVHVRDGFVETSVADEGIGISEEERARIFAPYFRGAEAGGKGHGLGLFISRALVQAHGGDLDVESAVGRGSTFRFRLPRARLEQST